MPTQRHVNNTLRFVMLRLILDAYYNRRFAEKTVQTLFLLVSPYLGVSIKQTLDGYSSGNNGEKLRVQFFACLEDLPLTFCYC